VAEPYGVGGGGEPARGVLTPQDHWGARSARSPAAVPNDDRPRTSLPDARRGDRSVLAVQPYANLKGLQPLGGRLRKPGSGSPTFGEASASPWRLTVQRRRQRMPTALGGALTSNEFPTIDGVVARLVVSRAPGTRLTSNGFPTRPGVVVRLPGGRGSRRSSLPTLFQQSTVSSRASQSARVSGATQFRRFSDDRQSRRPPPGRWGFRATRTSDELPTRWATGWSGDDFRQLVGKPPDLGASAEGPRWWGTTSRVAG
jgi:hypothetical protein